MITDFDDLCLYTYVIVDDILMKIEPFLRQPPPTPLCTDSEVITMVLVAECKGWDIETVNGQLSNPFGLETNHAHSFSGLCTRLYSKLTVHTLCIYLNQLLNKTSFLQIKELAFPVPSN